MTTNMKAVKSKFSEWIEDHHYAKFLVATIVFVWVTALAASMPFVGAPFVIAGAVTTGILAVFTIGSGMVQFG